MIELLQYWFVSGALLAAVGWCAEAVLRQRGREARWVWVTTAILTLASPLLPKLWAGTAAGAPDSSGVLALPGVELLESVPASVGGGGFGLVPAILLAWILVSIALLMVGAVALARLRRDARGWRPTTLLGQEVLLSSDFGPAVMGVRRPQIVVPDALPDCSTAELDMMLRHEREHIRSRDPLLLRLAYLVAVLMPWNLALLWQVSRLRHGVEQDCDLRVIAGGAPPREYGSLLLKMAARSGPTRPWMAAAALAEDRSGVARRLKLLRDRSGQARTTVTALLVIAGATALGVWMGVPSPVHFGHDADENEFEFEGQQSVDPDFDFDFNFEFDFDAKPKLAPVAETRVRMRYTDGVWREVLDATRSGIEIDIVEAELAKARLQAELQSRENLLQEAAERARGEGGESQTIRIRGNAPVDEEAEPLVYVDGVRVGVGKAVISEINPDDIERIEVLKGAAAEELYGEEGRNGVIRIFMKGGKQKPGGG